jgi:16S rRNA (guanine1207-N2)-methyltransferase
MKQPHMTQAPTTSAAPLHLVYGRPPLGLADVMPSAIQVSPLIPGSHFIEDLDDASADSAIVLAPAGTAERDYVIAHLLRALKPGGELTVMALKDKGGSRLRKGLEAFGCDVDESSKAHHRIAFVERPKGELALETALKAGAPRDLTGQGLWSQPGIFSWDRLDPGSALLIKSLPPLSGKGMDLGCGIGLLGLAVLQSAAVTALTLIDIDKRALMAAKLNVTDPRAQFDWADIRSQEGPGDQDFVVMNPPFHDAGSEDRALGQAFIRRAASALRKGGTCWLVANRHLPYEETLKPLFAKVTLKAEAGGYKVYEARK